MVSFNAGKTQCCLISRRVDRNLPDISFDSSSLEFRDKISMLGVTFGSDLSWNDHIISVAKAAACKLGLSFSDPHSTAYLIQGSNSPLSRILLAFVERSLQVFSCYLGCNSEAGYQTDRRPCINGHSRLPSPS